MNYTFQSFNFRGRNEMRPFYDLIANIAAEEFGHIELVSYAINLLLTGTTQRDGDPSDTPLAPPPMPGTPITSSPAASRRCRWTRREVLDRRERVLQRQPQARPAPQLLSGVRGARRQDPGLRNRRDPTARASVGLPAGPRRGAYRGLRPALEKLSGVAVGKLLPIPEISNKRFPEPPSMRSGDFTGSSTSSAPTTTDVGEIWNGAHPEDGSPLEVEVGSPHGFEVAGPGRRAAAHRAGRTGHRPRDVRGGRGTAVSGDGCQTQAEQQAQDPLNRRLLSCGGGTRFRPRLFFRRNPVEFESKNRSAARALTQ